MNRHRLLTISASTCLLSVGCVSTGELNEKIAKVQRESVRTIGVLEHRVADLQQRLADAQRSAIQTIQEEALVRGQETLTLKEQLGETEAFLAAQLASQSSACASERQAIKTSVAQIKRDLSARMDVETMARIDEQRELHASTKRIEQSIADRIEAIATSRQQDRDQVTDAIASLDREAATRIQAEQDTRELALAQLGDEVQGLHQQTLTAIADARRAIQDTESALYTQLAENREAFRADISEEAKKRDAQAQATSRLLEQRRLAATTTLTELGSRLAKLQERLELSRLAQSSFCGNKTQGGDATAQLSPLAGAGNSPRTTTP